MKRKWSQYLYSIIFFLGLILAVMPLDAIAAFTLSVTPYEGGYDLRYGKVSSVIGWVNKEVSVSINSDLQKRYRLVQTLAEPLTNSQGENISMDSLRVYGLRGSSKYGTLSVENEVPVRLGRTIIYTSNQTGDSDSFILVYKLSVPGDQQAGFYRGRISYVLEPVDSLSEAVTVQLNIYVDVEVNAKIEISTYLGRKSIELKDSGDENDRYKEVLVNIIGSFGEQFRISQVVSEPLADAMGKELPFDSVKFRIQGAKKGVPVVNDFTSLSLQPKLLYKSSAKGETDNFLIAYKLDDLTKARSGIYTTKLMYVMEGGNFLKQELIDAVELKIDIPQIFDFIVKPEVGGKIEFRDLKPLAPSKINEVLIEIRTNIGKMYQVSQNLVSELTSPEGNVMQHKNFTLREEGGTSGGILNCAEKTMVKTGETVLFVSNKEGAPDSFKVIYELGVPLNIISGDYSTRITYSLTEI
ncbi:MAG: hypothetical protein ABH815_03360 [Candidatus Omnitrophota bacterium]